MQINHINGFSLIEVLISLLLFALILFSLDGLQFYSLKLAKTAYYSHVAVNQLNNLTERLKALQTEEGFMQEVLTWNEENRSVLPEGFGTVTGVFPEYSATLCWDNKTIHSLEKPMREKECLNEKIQLA